ncbi:phosphopentomutase [Clostridium beijerinckii]|jgi:phosphopentomutase|uniref:Phosphopentomutase n=2 Tax=Clostridium beijerinckii TaxID=1520 RepID=DEOB_CLOB8|nr:phosphopentomutase [Clostridium beijerinckii]A6LY33.1 RecName: Full=Phosphopentomutase; AltName: Full=Phosphodeoxyribomutase [Clostridium beijerinckii NCIMB 8052]ABR35263.1 phosphopentomutase [Clostridium beijerinckii NCIMB 8052]AIU00631.1 phosphopentomutase [Clostridium beijerinckii ATCC 35702]MBF7810100.1 phosphopentomutase [Clostridium beijerinckii]NRT23339.1 phosphopentomutase [Clostridium beijerinckii]NRT69089.1 phosphopentomutase [Clostridium beijerinckii]
MKKYNRIFTIVIDSLGIGEMSDSKEYGDVNVDTLRHISESVDEFKIPNLQKLGLANLHPIKHVEAVEKPLAHFMKMREASVGKDTMTGHWEMMGLKIETPFQTFTDTGFPQELLDELEKRTGHKIVGNKSASGTEILDELGEHQIKTGDMIVYTSADSVLQICGHEETFGLDELYRCCEIARELTLKDEWKVGRVIARPYLGMKKGEFKRTSNRHDYALKPYGATALNALKDNGFASISVGKINDIFDGEGITESNKSKSSVHGMEQTLEIMDKEFKGSCFVNLVDFDALWGHRRNPVGYAEELEKFDVNLGKVLDKLKEDDLLIITADHGNDPTYKGTDHTREHVPFLAYSPSMTESGLMETSDSFAAIGATIAENFGVKMPENTIGESVLSKLV